MTNEDEINVTGPNESLARIEMIPSQYGLEIRIRPESDRDISSLQSCSLYLDVCQMNEFADRLRQKMDEVRELRSDLL